MVRLKEDERIDYATKDQTIKIIQSETVFSFSLDAVLLANFTYVPIKRGNILDLGTGNGIIPLLLSRKTSAKITGIEIQQRLADMAKRSMMLNHLTEQIDIIQHDLTQLQSLLPQSHFDVITCNPPYFATPASTEHNKNDYLTIARHEVCCTLEDVIQACKRYVRPGGKVSFVHRPERLIDLLTLFRNYRLEPKRLRFIYPKIGKNANMVLLEGVRDGKAGLKLLPPLYIYQADDTYTDEARAIIYE
ncbi:MAG TPA: tRNA1(Val) (adenine(37)-N6)-methyltransferase [Bacillota bacterium]|nr:tRNA1(Val) (adenine(37)-N6)-methyltransferase [Bacillota bacterium]